MPERLELESSIDLTQVEKGFQKLEEDAAKAGKEAEKSLTLTPTINTGNANTLFERVGKSLGDVKNKLSDFVTGSKKGLDDISTEAEKTTQSVKRISGAFSSLTKEQQIDAVTQGLKNVNLVAKDTGKELDEVSKRRVIELFVEQQKVKEDLNKIKVLKDQVGAKGQIIYDVKADNLKRELVDINGKIKNLLTSGKETTSRLGTLFGALGNSIQKSFLSVFGAFSAASFIRNQFQNLVQLLSDSVGVAVSFESAFAGVKKTVEGSDEELASFNEQLQKMTTTIPTTFEDLSKIAELGGQLGVPIQDMEKFVDTVARLGVSTNLSFETASTEIARFSNVLQEPLSNVDRLGASIVALGNNFATTESETLGFAQRLAAAGKVANFTSADILGIAAAASSVGVEAEAGGTAISKVFIQMATAAANGTSKLDGFAKVAGVTREEFQLLAQTNPSTAFLQFVEGLKSQGLEATNVISNLIGSDVRLQRVLLSLASGYDVLVSALNTSNVAYAQNQALIDESNKRFETTASKIQLTTNEITLQKKAIGEQLLPASLALKKIQLELFKVFSDTVFAISKLSDFFKEISSSIKFVSNNGSILGKVFSGLKDVMLNALGPMGDAVKILGFLKARLAEFREEEEGLSDSDALQKRLDETSEALADYDKQIASVNKKIAAQNALIADGKDGDRLGRQYENATKKIETYQKQLDELNKKKEVEKKLQEEIANGLAVETERTEAVSNITSSYNSEITKLTAQRAGYVSTMAALQKVIDNNGDSQGKLTEKVAKYKDVIAGIDKTINAKKESLNAFNLILGNSAGLTQENIALFQELSGFKIDLGQPKGEVAAMEALFSGMKGQAIEALNALIEFKRLAAVFSDGLGPIVRDVDKAAINGTGQLKLAASGAQGEINKLVQGLNALKNFKAETTNSRDFGSDLGDLDDTKAAKAASDNRIKIETDRLERQATLEIEAVKRSELTEFDKAKRIVAINAKLEDDIRILKEEGYKTDVDLANATLERYKDIRKAGQDAYNKIGKSIQDAVEDLSQLNDKVVDVQKKISETKAKGIEDLQKRYGDIKESLVEIDDNIDKATLAIANQKNKVDNVKDSYDTYNDLVKEATSNIEKQNDTIKKIQDDIQKQQEKQADIDNGTTDKLIDRYNSISDAIKKNTTELDKTSKKVGLTKKEKEERNALEADNAKLLAEQLFIKGRLNATDLQRADLLANESEAQKILREGQEEKDKAQAEIATLQAQLTTETQLRNQFLIDQQNAEIEAAKFKKILDDQAIADDAAKLKELQDNLAEYQKKRTDALAEQGQIEKILTRQQIEDAIDLADENQTDAIIRSQQKELDGFNVELTNLRNQQTEKLNVLADYYKKATDLNNQYFATIGEKFMFTNVDTKAIGTQLAPVLNNLSPEQSQQRAKEATDKARLVSERTKAQQELDSLSAKIKANQAALNAPIEQLKNLITKIVDLQNIAGAAIPGTTNNFDSSRVITINNSNLLQSNVDATSLIREIKRALKI